MIGQPLPPGTIIQASPPDYLISHESMTSMKTFTAALIAVASFAVSTATLAAAPAETLPSGVKVVHTTDGTGPQPKATDTVKVHYRGTLADGKEFDSSYKRGAPATFPLNRVVPCWTEGVQKIKVGGKATLTCPPATAYGDRGAGGRAAQRHADFRHRTAGD
jgi:FKBP-type peptidyl-prolyl cis-trans isomerase FkpA